MRYDDDPAAYDRLVLETLRTHYPMAAERVDPASFGLWSGRDLLQGALTPIVREDYARLSSGRYALAMGDAHTVVDPMMGQGANSASYSAWTIGEAIVADHVYDERFCQRVARRREGFVHGVSDWTNLMLNPPPHVQEFLGAMSQDKALCDEFTTNFNDPERQVDVLGTPERTRAYLALRGQDRESAAASDMHRLLVLYPPPTDPQAFRELLRGQPPSARRAPARPAGLPLGLRRHGARRRFAVLLRLPGRLRRRRRPRCGARLAGGRGDRGATSPTTPPGGALLLRYDVREGRAPYAGSLDAAARRRWRRRGRPARRPAPRAGRSSTNRCGMHRVADALGVGLAEADAQAAADDDRLDVEHVQRRGDARAERGDRRRR